MPKQVCLYYHIGECLGYCTKDINKDKYNHMLFTDRKNEFSLYLFLVLG